MDLWSQENKICIKQTRHVRLWPSYYPLASAPYQVVHDTLLKNSEEWQSRVLAAQPNAAQLAPVQGVLPGEATQDGRCTICKKFVVSKDQHVGCPACRGNKGSHKHTIKCKKAWCPGHPHIIPAGSPGAVVAPEEVQQPQVDMVNDIDAPQPPPPDSFEFFDADEGTVTAPAPAGQTTTSNTTEATGETSVTRALQRAGQLLGQAAGTAAASEGGLGVVGTIAADALGSGIGETIGEVMGRGISSVTSRFTSTNPTASSSNHPLPPGADQGGGPPGQGGGGSSAAAAMRINIEGNLTAYIASAITEVMSQMTSLPRETELSRQTIKEFITGNEFYYKVKKIEKPTGSSSPFPQAMLTISLKHGNPLSSGDKAKTSMRNEFNRLTRMMTWRLDSPVDWEEVKKQDPTACVVMLNPVLAVKNAEMSEDEQILKCRVVAGGDNIRDTYGMKISGREADDSSELYVVPSGLCAVRTTIAYGSAIKGRTVFADIDAAYVESQLRGRKTYGRLNKKLRELLPSDWGKGMKDPVLELFRALYGLPRSGYDWDVTFEGVAIKIGFKKLHDTEGSMYVYYNDKGANVILTLYVDDLIMAGPEELVNKLYAKIEERFTCKLQEGPIKKMLGVTFIYQELPDGSLWVGMRMTEYIVKLHDDYCKEAKLGVEMKAEHTPEYGEGYDFGSDHDIDGKLKGISRRYIGRVLYLTRACRLDAHHGVCVLATEVEDWRVSSDKKLTRVIAYLYTTKEQGPTWTFGKNTSEHEHHSLYVRGASDADHAGCLRTGRSKSGWITWIKSENVDAVVDWGSRRQGAAAPSTADAEAGALQDAWLKSVFPLGGTLDQCLGRDVDLEHDIDSSAALSAVEKGVSLALRYMRKVKRVSIAALHDMARLIRARKIESDKNESDVLTKPMKKETLVQHKKSLGFFKKVHKPK